MTEVKAQGLDEARAVLAEAGDTDMDNLGHLRHALAVADQLAGEVARLTAEREGLGSRLLFSQRGALDWAGVPTVSPEGAPVSDGWRAAWAAEEVVRLRAVAPRWVGKDYDKGPRLWRLFVGPVALLDSGILTATDRLPVMTVDAEPFPTLHEAARAVCERLGLPLITEGLPKENADV